MCGRFTLFDNKDVIENEFEVEIEQPELFNPSYNIAPTQNSLVIYTKEDQRVCSAMRWGLVPFWAKDIKIGYKMINARAETVAEKTSFQKSLEGQEVSCVNQWIYKQKNRYNKGKLSQEKIDLLKKLNVNFD